MPSEELLAQCPAEVVEYVRVVDAQVRTLLPRLQQVEQQVREAKRQATPFRRTKRTETRKKPGRKGGHEASRRADPPAIDEHCDAPVPAACTSCGHAEVVETGSYEQIQEDLEISRHVRKIVVHVGCCKACGEQLEGRHPWQTSTARGAAAHQLGPTAMALATQLHYQEGVPFEKVADVMRELGLPVATATLVRAMQRIAERGEPAFGELLSRVLAQDVLHIDETGWSLDGDPHYLWVLTGAEVTVYFVRKTRSGDEVADFLADFSGVLVTDGHAGYDELGTKLLRALCLLHLERNIKELEAKNVGRAKSLAKDIRWWLDGAIALVGDRAELGPKFFAKEAANLEAQFFTILDVQSSSASNMRMVARLLKWQDAVLRCLRDPRVPATNNQAERQIRPAVVLRKRGGCNRSTRGASTFERLASIAATLRQHKRSFMTWVADLLKSPTPAPLFE